MRGDSPESTGRTSIPSGVCPRTGVQQDFQRDRNPISSFAHLRDTPGDQRLVSGYTCTLSCIPPHDEDLGSASLYERLADRGVVPSRAVGTQVAAPATAEDAELLDLEVGAPLFVERRLVTSAEGIPIEATESRYAGSRFVFQIELLS